MGTMKKLLLFTLMLLLSASVLRAPTCVPTYTFETSVDPSFTASLEYEACSVEVKAGTPIYTFTEDGCQLGYCVTGIGTLSIEVTRVCESGSTCKDISNIKVSTWQEATAIDMESFSVSLAGCSAR